MSTLIKTFYIIKDIETQKFFTDNWRENFFSKDDEESEEFDSIEAFIKAANKDIDSEFPQWAQGKTFEPILRIKISYKED